MKHHLETIIKSESIWNSPATIMMMMMMVGVMKQNGNTQQKGHKMTKR